MKKLKKSKNPNRKVLLPLTATTKQLNILYNAALRTYPDLHDFIYQASREELKILKILAIRAIIKDLMVDYLKESKL